MQACTSWSTCAGPACVQNLGLLDVSNVSLQKRSYIRRSKMFKVQQVLLDEFAPNVGPHHRVELRHICGSPAILWWPLKAGLSPKLEVCMGCKPNNRSGHDMDPQDCGPTDLILHNCPKPLEAYPQPVLGCPRLGWMFCGKFSGWLSCPRILTASVQVPCERAGLLDWLTSR